MLVKDVVEEIIEKLPSNTVSIQSILRKITNVRDTLIRNYGPAQRQSDAIVSELDLLQGIGEYPLPCPPGNVVDVEILGTRNGPYSSCENSGGWTRPPVYPIKSEPTIINDCWFRLPYRQFDERYNGPYYYFLSGTIGIHPKSCESIPRGIKIFHIPVVSSLSVGDMNGPTGFDPNFDMVLVYGVLKDMVSGPQSSEYEEKYKQWLYDYQTANSGWERYVVDERW